MSLDERLRSLDEVAARIPVGDVDSALRRVRHRGRKRPQRRALLGVVAIAAAVALFLAVGHWNEEDDIRVTTQPGSSDWQSLLRSTPAEATRVEISDLSRLAQQLGVRAPAPDAPDVEVAAYRNDVWRSSDFAAGHALPLDTASPGEVRAELGFDHRAIDRILTFQGVDHRSREPRADVMEGAFDVEAIEATLAADQRWAPLQQRRTYRGSEFFTWERDNAGLPTRTPMRQLGRGGHLLVEPSSAVWASSSTSIEAVIDARVDPARRLAANRKVMTVVEHLDRQQAAIATVVQQGAARTMVGTDVHAVGWGYHRQDGRPTAEIALAYKSAAAARAGRAQLQERLKVIDDRTGSPIGQQLTITTLSVSDSLLVATLHFTGETPIGGSIARLLPRSSSAHPIYDD